MQVELSLEEMLINAISSGRVAGVQFKRGWSDESATFASLRAVIDRRIESARQVAIESALHQFNDEQGTLRLRRAEMLLADAKREADSCQMDGGCPVRNLLK